LKLQDFQRDKMPDLKFSYNPAIGGLDISFNNGDVEYDRDICTAVILSLFTDARAPDTFIPPDGSQDRRGSWQDYYDTSPTGSLLWTLRRAIITDSTTLLNLAKTYALSSLQWLKTTGVVNTIDVSTSWLNKEALAIAVTVTEPNSTQVNLYTWAWSLNPQPKPVINNPQIIAGYWLGINFILGESYTGG
jgi:phage gp46-like protein